MAGLCIALSLTLGLTACLFATANPIPEQQKSDDWVSPGPSITNATAAVAVGNLNSDPVTPPGGGGGGANHTAAEKVTTPARATPTPGATPVRVVSPDRNTATPKASTLAVTIATPSTTLVMGPKVTTPARTTATPRTTLVMGPKVTTPARTIATPRMTLVRGPKVTTPARTSATPRPIPPVARIQQAPDRTGTFVVLFLLLLLLAISLYGAWLKLRSYGGSGSYYPGQAGKHLYVSPEEGEAEDGGPRHMGRAFMAAVRNLLARKPGYEGEEEQEEEEERAQLTPRDGESDGEEEEEEDGEEAEEDGGPAKGEETDQSDSDDYSSLGGLDLRERAARAGGGEEDFPDPPSPSSDELLSDLHSFSGTASWTDTNHDVTAL